MLDNYLIVHKSILPSYFEAVIKTKNLLEDGKALNVSEACKETEISRSTYYKYKDYVLEMTGMNIGRKAVLSMLLSHETGVLSNVLSSISQAGGSVLTITQSLPVRGKASVTISLDISNMPDDVGKLIDEIALKKGVENPKLVAVE